MDLERVAEPVAFRGRQYDAGPQAESHLGPVEVHAPMRRVGRWRQVLGLGPVDEEVGQGLRLDCGAGLVEDGVAG